MYCRIWIVSFPSGTLRDTHNSRGKGALSFLDCDEKILVRYSSVPIYIGLFSYFHNTRRIWSGKPRRVFSGYWNRAKETEKKQIRLYTCRIFIVRDCFCVAVEGVMHIWFASFALKNVNKFTRTKFGPFSGFLEQVFMPECKLLDGNDSTWIASGKKTNYYPFYNRSCTNNLASLWTVINHIKLTSAVAKNDKLSQLSTQQSFSISQQNRSAPIILVIGPRFLYVFENGKRSRKFTKRGGWKLAEVGYDFFLFSVAVWEE